MILDRFVVGRLQANCYVVGDEETREVMVVDPGDQGPALVAQIRERDYRPVAIFVTHAHLDHSGASHEMLEAFPEAAFWMHEADYLAIEPQSARADTWYGHPITVPRRPDRMLEHGDALPVGSHSFTALHTPGHTVGSICVAGEGVVFTGDVLFQGSIGRYNFPGGDGPTLIRSIRQHLLALPDETVVLPGHGPQSTVGTERAQNPFLTATRQVLGFDPDED
jgi:hydroxyacylglutathione hydrolase